ncbi:MAG: VanZ family protein [Oscillospiraceae bacterium]|nr:VanZ family protein [Oscillospiraceae bacterium]
MEDKRFRRAVWILFLIYLAVLLLLLFHRLPREGHAYNLRPFTTIRDYFLVMRMQAPWESALRAYGWVNFLGNVLVFIPLGVFLPLLFRRQRRFLLFLLTVVAAVCLIELAQYATRLGALDVDDLILNVPGACLGWLLWRLWERRRAAERDDGDGPVD